MFAQDACELVGTLVRRDHISKFFAGHRSLRRFQPVPDHTGNGIGLRSDVLADRWPAFTWWHARLERILCLDVNGELAVDLREFCVCQFGWHTVGIDLVDGFAGGIPNLDSRDRSDAVVAGRERLALREQALQAA